MPQNTIYKQKSQLDQFYTKPQVAYQCYQLIFSSYKESDFDLFLEPSAGNGSFLNFFPIDKRLGLDIDPKSDEIECLDFFLYSPPLANKNIIVIGNPPFGRVCSMAVKFFNKAAEFADVIAFIVPKTFNTAGVRSISKGEFVMALIRKEYLINNHFPFNNTTY